MTTIRQDDVIRSVADALQHISYYHPLDYIQNLAKAYEREESPAARDAMAQILINSRMCAEGHRPLCQDTGIVTVFVKVGMNVQWDATLSLTDMINEGVRQAYMNPDNKLRASIVADPAAGVTPVSSTPSAHTRTACPSRWPSPDHVAVPLRATPVVVAVPGSSASAIV